eukprot:gene7728-9058_t
MDDSPPASPQKGTQKIPLGETEGSDPKMKASIMRVLVATDNHLGYLERDPIRGDDSFNSFEEILQYAHELKVDMILLGGDLFHDNKPSRSCLYKTIELFRKYCLGDSPVKIQFLSDQTVNFFNKFHTVNYEDPNFNISLPVFSIHGNHDDPTGEGGLAALDLLSVSNLVNYFGKIDNIDDISVYPLLLAKGETKMAIYGLGNVRDERLYRTFQKQQVKLMRPIESKEDWFNILVLHQNRVAHNPKNYVHEQMIDNFIDFVLWGHEHECLINPQPSSIGEFHITQPGSSVATALSEGESKDKFVGLLEVYKNQFRFKTFPLKTVRPFIMDSIILADSKIHPNELTEIGNFIEAKVESMILQAQEKSKGKPSEKMLPLIRLKIDYTGYSTLNPQKFGQQFTGRVANPNDILLFSRKKVSNVSKKVDPFADDKLKDNEDKIRVEDFISEFLGNTAADRLNILSESDLHVALHNFVEKDENDALGSDGDGNGSGMQDDGLFDQDITLDNTSIFKTPESTKKKPAARASPKTPAKAAAKRTPTRSTNSTPTSSPKTTPTRSRTSTPSSQVISLDSDDEDEDHEPEDVDIVNSDEDEDEEKTTPKKRSKKTTPASTSKPKKPKK